MFCVKCGTSLPDAACFCSSCGNAVASPSAGSASPPFHSPAPTNPPFNSPAHGSPPNQYGAPSYFPQMPASPPIYSQDRGLFHRKSSTVLISPQGQPQPALERLASALFDALDQSFAPQRTGGLEVSKMQAYRTLGGLTVPPYYGEYVLPTYASVVGIDLVPNRPPTAPIVSRTGWQQFLSQKIRLEPEATFLHLNRLVAALQIPLTLSRADFPAAPDPQAQAKEAQFKAAIYSLAQRGMGAGAFGTTGFSGAGFGMGMGGAGLPAGNAGPSNSKIATQAFAKLAVNGGTAFMNAAFGGGMGS